MGSLANAISFNMTLALANSTVSRDIHLNDPYESMRRGDETLIYHVDTNLKVPPKYIELL